MPRVSYTAPATVDEAVKALAGAAGQAKVLSGGTDLLVQLKSGRLKPELIVDTKKIPGIMDIREEGGEVDRLSAPSHGTGAHARGDGNEVRGDGTRKPVGVAGHQGYARIVARIAERTDGDRCAVLIRYNGGGRPLNGAVALGMDC